RRPSTLFSFFSQAEDGIRDRNVTGVQTCALPICCHYLLSSSKSGVDNAQRKQMAIMGFISPIMIGIISLNVPGALPLYWAVSGRSEERRVGTEWRTSGTAAA